MTASKDQCKLLTSTKMQTKYVEEALSNSHDLALVPHSVKKKFKTMKKNMKSKNAIKEVWRGKKNMHIFFLLFFNKPYADCCCS